MRRSLKVTITKVRRRVVVWSRLETVDAYCLSCGCTVETLSRSEALKIAGIEEDDLDDMAASGEVHAIQIENAYERICSASLLDKQSNPK